MYETNKYTLRYFISFTCVFTILISCVQCCECVSLFVHYTHCTKFTKCVQYICAFSQTIGWSGIRTHGMLCIPQFSRLIPLTAQTSILCTTMHVNTRPDKGISIIWSLCVPYVQMHSTKFVHVCTICLWYLRQYHLKLYGA